MTSMSCKLEPAIWSHVTGQQIPYFDRCQLIITWLSDIKEVHGKPRLHVSVNLHRRRRRRRAYAPTSNTASHGTHEKINSWVPFSSLIWVWGSAWRPWAAGAPLIFYKPLFQAQVLSIKHLLSENNTFLSFDELKQKVNINVPFRLYYGLITSIPTEWKKLLRNQNSCSQSVISTPAPLHDPPSTRTAYSFLLDKAISPPTSEIRILNHGFTKENIHKVYTFPFSITKDSKLIAFQYNITHHILPTNSSLFRAGIAKRTKSKNRMQITEFLARLVNMSMF